MKRKSSTVQPKSSNFNAAKPKSPIWNSLTLAIIAGVFIMGIGLGVAFSNSVNISPQNVASREFIDRSAPNAELCINYGATAMVMDTRVFVTLNPFNVYVNQPLMQPGCVLRQNNWSILEQRKLVRSDQVRDCRHRMNTFGFTGTLESSPNVSCIYQSDSEKNRYLNQPGAGAPPPEAERF